MNVLDPIDEVITHTIETAKRICSCIDGAASGRCPVIKALDELTEIKTNNLITQFPYGMDQKYVYHLIDGSGGMMERLNAHRIHINRTAAGKPFYEIDGVDIDPEDFGATAFLTKEEAWSALEKFWDGEYQEDE